jgi:hypothetical protein
MDDNKRPDPLYGWAFLFCELQKLLNKKKAGEAY